MRNMPIVETIYGTMTKHGLQVGRNYGMWVISKRESRNVPKSIPKRREWITIMCCVNAICASILWFYLLKG